MNSLAEAKDRLLVADSLLGLLDRSPEVYNWDAFITTRLLGLEPIEHSVIKEWVLSLSGSTNMLDEDCLARAYETVELLSRETARLRALTGIGKS